jgi:cob(I)alamin adenosyltransferase
MICASRVNHSLMGLLVRLIEIQCRLFDLGACVATPPNSEEDKISYTKVKLNFSLLLPP